MNLGERKQVILTPIWVAISSLTLVAIAVSNRWFGAESEGIMNFCEQARDGLVKQPSNTFSNFGFVIIGLYIGWIGYKNKFNALNRMTTTIFYPAFYASVVLFLGPGSMAWHATNTYWGGFADLTSMFLLSSFVFSYAIMRWYKFSKQTFILIYLINMTFCSMVYLSPFNDIVPYLGLSSTVFALQLILGSIYEIMNRYVKGNKINASKGWITAFLMGLAFFIWNISKTQDSFFCNPKSYIQGHAIWHLLTALAAYFLFRFYASEEDLNDSIKIKN